MTSVSKSRLITILPSGQEARKGKPAELGHLKSSPKSQINIVIFTIGTAPTIAAIMALCAPLTRIGSQFFAFDYRQIESYWVVSRNSINSELEVAQTFSGYYPTWCIAFHLKSNSVLPSRRSGSSIHAAKLLPVNSRQIPIYGQKMEDNTLNATTAIDRQLIDDSQQLQKVVSRLIGDKRLEHYQKRQQIADLAKAQLNNLGVFHHTTGGNFFAMKGSLLDVEGQEFAGVLKAMTGLTPDCPEFRDLFRRLKASLDEQNLISAHKLSYYDPESSSLIISDGAGGVWRRELGGNWSHGTNGDDGVFFAPYAIEPFQPEFDSQINHLHWFVDQFRFRNVSRLSAGDQQNLLVNCLLHRFFPPLCGSRIIPAFLGIPGALKSTALRLLGELLVGSRFSVMDMSTMRRDDFDAVYGAAVLAIDNVDPKTRWLIDSLSNYATASCSVELAILIISSRELHSVRPDLAERFLPFYCERPSNFTSDYRIMAELRRRRGAIMGNFMLKLGAAADRLAVTRAKPVALRMADFGSFNRRLAEGSKSSKSDTVARLTRLQLAQADLACDGDDTVLVIQMLLDRDGQIMLQPIGQIYQQCKQVAAELKLIIPPTVQGFGQRFSNLMPMLEAKLNARIREVRGHAGTRNIEIIPNCGTAAEQLSPSNDHTTADWREAAPEDGLAEDQNDGPTEPAGMEPADPDHEVGEQNAGKDDADGHYPEEGEADGGSGTDSDSDQRHDSDPEDE